MTVSELEKPSKQSSSLSPQAAAGSQVNPLKEETWNVAMARVSLGLLGGVMILAMHGAIVSTTTGKGRENTSLPNFKTAQRFVLDG